MKKKNFFEISPLLSRENSRTLWQQSMLRFSHRSLFKNVAVWGGGTMGGGIAQITAAAKIPVTVVEVSDSRIEVARKNMTTSLTRVAKKMYDGNEAQMKKFVDETISFVTFTTNEEQAAGKADLIVEAIIENIEAKRTLWKKLDAVAGKDCIFATNTSSLKVSDQAAVTNRRERFGGLHFFSPVALMKLVEVVKADETSQETVDALYSYSKAIGKVPVIARDTKGFIVNRLLIPYMLEACRLVERGDATFQDVDTAMKLGAGYPMGPFQLSDSVGIDVMKLIADAWNKEEPTNPLFFPSKLINDKVAEGKLGIKSGEGFYNYKK
jgi:3-hydroxyacyl-CoA dehydrogenase